MKSDTGGRGGLTRASRRPTTELNPHTAGTGHVGKGHPGWKMPHCRTGFSGWVNHPERFLLVFPTALGRHNSPTRKEAYLSE